MKPEFILMLTHNDKTVKEALKIFRECKDAPVVHWGFKDVGLAPDEMKTLVREMKDAGKTTYLEVVSLSEEEGLRGAEIAVESGFDVLMGTIFFDSILVYLKGKPIQYYPFLDIFTVIPVFWTERLKRLSNMRVFWKAGAFREWTC